MSSFRFYADSGLVVPLTTGAFAAAAGGPVADRVVWFGSTEADLALVRVSAPGVDPVQVAVEDTDELAGLADTAVRLALSAAGLDAATPGAPLALGTSLASGVANAIPVYVRVSPGAAPVGQYTDLQLVVDDIMDIAA